MTRGGSADMSSFCVAAVLGGIFLVVCDAGAVGAGNGSGHSRVISAVAIE